jgi:metallo-beta-lactamase class B
MRKTAFFFLFAIISLQTIAQNKYHLKITHLTDNLYVYVSYGTYQGLHYPANAMYMVTDKGVVLFDTPWGKHYYQPLLDSIWNRHHKKVILCISTHFHEDRTGGLKYYNGKGIKTYTTYMTDSLSILDHNNRAKFLLYQDTTFHVGQNSFTTYYPGPGHTSDNIVIWLPKQKVLYGGCFIKSVSDSSLGNLEDANVQEWGNSLRRLQNKFPDPRFIIVGHNGWADKQSIQHTLQLVDTANR